MYHFLVILAFFHVNRCSKCTFAILAFFNYPKPFQKVMSSSDRIIEEVLYKEEERSDARSMLCLKDYACLMKLQYNLLMKMNSIYVSFSYTLFFYKEPTSRPSSKSSLFIDLKSANCSTKSSLIVP